MKRRLLLVALLGAAGCDRPPRAEASPHQPPAIRKDIAASAPSVAVAPPVDTAATQVPLTILEACAAFAEVLTASATAQGNPASQVGAPRDSSMSFPDMDRPEPACRVAWHADSGYAPLADVFARAKTAGWTERPLLLAADGPDGSVQAVSRGNVACLVSGEWDGGDDSDSTYVPADGFTVSVACFANRSDRG